ncbi:M28 family peptidase [Labilibaculum sp. A4]|uniref:M28 family metallopeptidase n=1 Tax=Labilibaculum euxinus TaxID=2686357 RepID=UPI000F616E9F|nr:M28 family peptidase [Labilibaculum euxinus]MDQ1771512.1 M28 family peptidase [Labilibaculum euxinus]MWN76600.1 M28 family peptidase [Labilibaculum euxinus]
MRSIIIILFISVSNLFHLSAQDSIALYYSKSLSTNKIQNDIVTLSSDSMEGRDTGSKGQKLAAQYICQQFINAGVNNPKGNKDRLGYFQNFAIYKKEQADAEIQTIDKIFKNYEDILISGFTNYSNNNMDLVFLGTAPDTSYINKDYSDKAVLFLSTNLYAAAIKSNDIVTASKAKLVLFCNPNKSRQYMELLAKKRTISPRGMNLKPDNNNDFNPFDSISSATSFTKYKNRMHTYQGAISNPVACELLQIKPKRLKQILETKKMKKTEQRICKFTFNFDLKYKELSTENVFAFLPGTNKKEEVLVISAHYDHVGKNDGEIFNGANDNASGTAAIIEIARKFQEASDEGHKTKRSILFAAFTGEEKGLCGSKYFVDNPPFPLSDIVGNLNLDMLGRHDEFNDTTDYVYLLGTNHLKPKLKVISDSINQISTKLRLDYKYDMPDNFLYQASDQASFVKHGIPAVFYFNGLHADYHKASDTAEKIDFQAINRVSQLVFLTAWEMANEE